MEKWEYITIKFETEDNLGGTIDSDKLIYGLNKLGDRGWELVSCISPNGAYGKSKEVMALLKRRK